MTTEMTNCESFLFWPFIVHYYSHYCISIQFYHTDTQMHAHMNEMFGGAVLHVKVYIK